MAQLVLPPELLKKLDALIPSKETRRDRLRKWLLGFFTGTVLVSIFASAWGIVDHWIRDEVNADLEAKKHEAQLLSQISFDAVMDAADARKNLTEKKESLKKVGDTIRQLRSNAREELLRCWFSLQQFKDPLEHNVTLVAHTAFLECCQGDALPFEKVESLTHKQAEKQGLNPHSLHEDIPLVYNCVRSHLLVTAQSEALKWQSPGSLMAYVKLLWSHLF